MTKHTPGPWALDDESIYAPGGEGWKQVAEIPNWRTNPGEVLTPEDNANARLIAAAPDMLEALQALANWGPFQNGYAPDDAFSKIQSMTRAAIAKATGG